MQERLSVGAAAISIHIHKEGGYNRKELCKNVYSLTLYFHDAHIMA